jgi:hypothetical protein
MTEPSTLRDCVNLILQSVPESLIGAAARRRIVAVAEQLPDRMHAPLFGFECALGTAETPADLLVSAVGRRRGPLALHQASAAFASKFPDSSWRSVQRLADWWQDNGGIDHFWLEFDVGGPAPQIPNLFFGPGEGDASATRGESLLSLMQELGPELMGIPLDTDLTESLVRLLDVLPPQACIFQIGAMRARQGSGVRVCINEIYFDGIPRLLEQLDYPEVQEVGQICQRLQPFADACALQIDLSPRLSADVGIEVYVAPGCPADDRLPRERRFVEMLETEGLCSTEKADSLMAYSGVSDVLTDPDAWPADLVDAGSLISRRSSFLRRIHHFKIGCGSKSPRAKAYLAAQHVWLPSQP